MKILYDHQAFTMQKFGGVSRYFAELISHFKAHKLIEVDLGLGYSDNVYLDNLNFAQLPKVVPNKFTGKSTLLHLLNKPVSKKKIMSGDYDIFHPTYYNPYFLDYLKDRKFVLTVHDMNHELFPDKVNRWDKTASFKKILSEKASKIICVSHNTKQDLCRILKTDEKKIKVIHLASSFRKVDESLSGFFQKKEYILYVGSRGYYKNFQTFLSAAGSILKDNPDIYLICAGGGDFNKYELRRFETLGIKDKIIYKPVDDKLLQILYSNATLFVLPSIYEGFGIPLLEAFNCGCPVITSNVSSLPEIAGDAALYFDPHDELSIKNAILQLIDNKQLQEELIQKGRIRSKLFSWEKTAEMTAAVYSGT